MSWHCIRIYSNLLLHRELSNTTQRIPFVRMHLRTRLLFLHSVRLHISLNMRFWVNDWSLFA